MRVCNLLKELNEFFPFDSAYDFDNVGLIVGDKNAEITSILLCVDVTECVVEEAVKKGHNTIISHHPIIFNAVKKITTDNVWTNIAIKAIKNDINLIALHTNADDSFGGINDNIASFLSIEDVKIFGEDKVRYGELNQPIKLCDLAKKIKDFTNDSKTIVMGNENKIIKSVAMVSGSGGGDENLAYKLKELNVDAYYTAEMKHNVSIVFNALNIAVIQCGHFESEKLFTELVKKLFENKFVNIIAEISVNEKPLYKLSI